MAEAITQICEARHVTSPPELSETCLNPRVSLLRQLALSFANELDSTERGKAFIDSYEQTEGEPVIIRRAKAISQVLETQSLILDEGQLIAGRVQRLIPAHNGIHSGHEWKRSVTYPEGGGWISDNAPVSESIRKRWAKWCKNYVPVWQKLGKLLPDDERKAIQAGVYSSGGIDWVHRNSRFEMLLEMGMTGIKKQAKEKLRLLDEKHEEYEKQRSFYESIIIICDALMSYANRWAEKLDELATSGENSERRSELQQMAAICRKVPHQPPETFHEAIQSVWFAQVANWAEASGSAHSFGRFDQYMWPFYYADVEAGKLTRDDALELIQCLWLKCYSTFDFRHLTVGGVKPDGADGTNELSYLCLEATEQLRTPRDVAVRVHNGTPDAFLKKAADVARIGLGRPDFWGDEVTVESLAKAGIPLADARDYSPIGCVELTIAGKCNSRTMGHSMNLAKCLELALNNGRDQITNQQIGPQTGEEFGFYKELHAAYRKQAEHFIRLAIQQNLRAYALQAKDFPMPVLSTLTEGCLESGHDVMDGGATYNPAGVNLFGVANIANSLAAIKKLVFEENTISLKELRHAMTKNFEGQEPLRQMLLNRAPKYGNGDEYVDNIAAEEAAFYCDEVAKYPTPEGGQHHALIFGTSPPAVYGFAQKMGASADGRKMGEPIAMSVCTTHGTERMGSTATVKSAASLDYTKAPGGISFILDLHPTAVSGNSGLNKLASLLKTYFRSGGMEIGLNIVSDEDLRKAQENPDRYSHIMVRVFGFSTQFISLSHELQEYVIEKTKQVN